VAFTVEFLSQASPEQVLAAIREEMREWRESALPEKLRKRAWRVAARIEGSTFTLYYESNTEAGPDVALRGSVAQSTAGVTRVVATAGLHRSFWGVGIIAAIGLVLTLARPGVALSFIILAAVVGVFWWLRDRGVHPNQLDASHLVERLRRAVAAAHLSSGSDSVQQN
jgi:Flp pilus assembly protein TadB